MTQQGDQKSIPLPTTCVSCGLRFVGTRLPIYAKRWLLQDNLTQCPRCGQPTPLPSILVDNVDGILAVLPLDTWSEAQLRDTANSLESLRRSEAEAPELRRALLDVLPQAEPLVPPTASRFEVRDYINWILGIIQILLAAFALNQSQPSVTNIYNQPAIIEVPSAPSAPHPQPEPQEQLPGGPAPSITRVQDEGPEANARPTLSSVPKEYRNREFNSGEVILDGNTFVGCRFRNCTMLFNGTALPKLIGNTFDGNVKWMMDGAAENTGLPGIEWVA